MMKKVDIKALAKAAKTYISENEDNLTSKGGLVLVLAGAALGIYAAVKCTHKLDNMEPDICECRACKAKVANTPADIYNHVRNNHPDINAQDVMENTGNYFKMKHSGKQIGKVCWKHAVAPVVMMGTGSYGIIRSDKKMMNKIATLTTTTQIAETLMTDYREEVAKELGPEKEEEVLTRAYAKDVDRTWIDDLNPIDTGHGDEVFYLYWGGKYILSSPEFIREKVNDLDEMIYRDDMASWGDFLEKIDVHEKGSEGQDYGWNVSKMNMKHLRFVPSSKIVGSGHSVTVIGFSEPPKLGWTEYAVN